MWAPYRLLSFCDFVIGQTITERLNSSQSVDEEYNKDD